MPFIRYKQKNFRDASMEIIWQAREILDDYERQGFDLTLRQLYYQFVSKDLIPNHQRSYDRLGAIINDARMAGLIDWDHIIDRTRNVVQWQTQQSPAEAARAAAERYRRDRWEDQPNHVEVWIEKDALVGVISPACMELMIPYFSCRGYTSQSEMWGAAQRLFAAAETGKEVTILHLGDHDPSGIDMTRDIRERLALFMASDKFIADGGDSSDAIQWMKDTLTVERIALTMDQVHEFRPPPNPAKLSDSRADEYISRYGNSSWELDALSPSTLDALIKKHVGELMDADAYDDQLEREAKEQKLMLDAADEWDEKDN
jgi:hypothetical protein